MSAQIDLHGEARRAQPRGLLLDRVGQAVLAQGRRPQADGELAEPDDASPTEPRRSARRSRMASGVRRRPPARAGGRPGRSAPGRPRRAARGRSGRARPPAPRSRAAGRRPRPARVATTASRRAVSRMLLALGGDRARVDERDRHLAGEGLEQPAGVRSSKGRQPSATSAPGRLARRPRARRPRRPGCPRDARRALGERRPMSSGAAAALEAEGIDAVGVAEDQLVAVRARRRRWCRRPSGGAPGARPGAGARPDRGSPSTARAISWTLSSSSARRLLGLEAAHVVDGHRRLRGERQGHLLVLGGERAAGLVGEVEVAEDLAAQRDGHARGTSPSGGGGPGTRPSAGRRPCAPGAAAARRGSGRRAGRARAGGSPMAARSSSPRPAVTNSASSVWLASSTPRAA